MNKRNTRQQVRAFLQQYAMASPGSHILCALSGGADSVAMVELLHSLQGQMGFRLACGHFSHGIRPHKAEEEADLCRKLCQDLGLPFYHGSGDTPDFARQHKLGLEEAARKLRYDFLQATAADIGADKIATAHNREDNAETVLLNLLRGSGLAGLSGIPPVRDNIIRPLLCLSRRDIENYLQDRPVVVDESNRCTDYTRNRLRLEIMPQLTAINSRAVENIAMAGLRMRQEHEAAQGAAKTFFKTHMGRQGDTISCAVLLLQEQKSAFLARIIRMGYGALGGDMGEMTAVHTDAVIELVRHKLPPKYVVLPGNIHARLQGKNLILYKHNGEQDETRY